MASPTNFIGGSDAGSDTIRSLQDPEESLSSKHGWANVSTVIRQIDTEEIDGYNKDLDAILTFAGIYSAALTAFLVESYKDLQPDPQATMVFLLQQLVLQTNSFTINDRFINSTLSHPTLVPDFVPSLNARRVNGLWFASLTLSLISASFILLVKQWLREFIPTEQSSPREYLRIRHFRLPGLTKYRVYEIAAFLPFLIQLSLLLFFLGLCFFTASVQREIWRGTISLISAWGFFLLAMVFIPPFDPVCPYKVPALRMLFAALKGLLRLIHPQGKRKADSRNAASTNETTQVNQGDQDIPNPPPPQQSNSDKVSIPQMFIAALKRLPRLIHPRVESQLEAGPQAPALTNETTQVNQGDQDIPNPPPPQQSNSDQVSILRMLLAALKRLPRLRLPRVEIRFEEGPQNAALTNETTQANQGNQNPPNSPALQQPNAVSEAPHASIAHPRQKPPASVSGNTDDEKHTALHTEEEAAKSEEQDVTILVDALEIDAVQANDEILRDVMCEALLQASIAPEKLLQLPFAVVNSRLKHDGGRIFPGEYFDMGTLSYQSYTTITYMLALLVEKAMETEYSAVKSHLPTTAPPPTLPSLPKWLEHSICALLCNTQYTPLSIVTRALYSCLPKHHSHFFRLVRSRSASHSISLHSVLKTLQSGLVKEKSNSELFKYAVSMMRPIAPDHSSPIRASDSLDIIIKDLRRKDNTPIPLECKPILKNIFKPRIKMDSHGANLPVKTLACMDAILLDDEFLKQEILTPGQLWCSTIGSADGAAQLLNLLMEVIRNRLRYEVPAGRVLNLAELDKPVYTMITRLAAQIYKILCQKLDSKEPSSLISGAAQTDTDTYNPLRENAACILLSPSKDDTYERDEDVIMVLQLFFSDERYKRIAQLIGAQYLAAAQVQTQLDNSHHDGWIPKQSMVLKRLKDGFVSIDNAEVLISFIQTLFPCATSSALVPQREAGSVLFDAEGQIAYDIPGDCLETVLDLFLSRLQVRVGKTFGDDQWFGTYQPLLFETVFRLLPPEEELNENFQEVDIFIRNVLSAHDLRPVIGAGASYLPRDALTICDIALNVDDYPAQARLAAQAAFARAATCVNHSQGLQQILTVLEIYRRTSVSKSSNLAVKESNTAAASTDLDSCLTFRFYLQLLNNPHPRVHHENHHEQWTRLFESVLPSLQKLRGTGLLANIAAQCLRLISQISTTFNSRGLVLPYRQKYVVSLLEDIISGSVHDGRITGRH